MSGYLVAKRKLSGLVISFQRGSQWILGSDPREANIVLKDPLISKKHVICYLTQSGYFLENLDLYSPAMINGKIITGRVLLQENDVLKIGGLFFQFTEKKPKLETTSATSSAAWLLKTLSRYKLSNNGRSIPVKDISTRTTNWKDVVIPQNYILGATISFFIAVAFFTADFSLSRKPSNDTKTSRSIKNLYGIEKKETDHRHQSEEQIEQICMEFPEIVFSFTPAKGRLFLKGHVDTIKEKQKLMSELSSLPFIQSTEDNIITDELVWQTALRKKIQEFSPLLRFQDKVGQALNNCGEQFVCPINYTVENCTQIFVKRSASKRQKMKTAARSAFVFTFTILLYEIGDAIDRMGDFFKTTPYNYLPGKVKEKPPLLQDSFSVLSGNLCMLPYGIWAYEGLRPPTQRMDELAQKILQSHSDFICLQEISTSHANTLWQKIQNQYAHGFSRIGPMPLHRMNNGLFFASKYPIEKTLYYPLPSSGAIDRGLFCAKTQFGWIITGHLSAGKSESDVLIRKEQIASLQKLCEYLSEKGTIPCIVAIDSNIPRLGGINDEYTLSKMSQYFQNSMYPSSSFSLTREKATCTNLLNPAIQGQKTQKLEEAYEHIDYILSYKPSSHLLSLKVTPIPTYFLPNSLPLSDHKFLLAKAQLSKKFIPQKQKEYLEK